MDVKYCWFLACGPIPPSRMGKLERRVAALMSEFQREDPRTALSTDFYYYNIFPNWPDGQFVGGSMSLPGVCAVRPGDRAVLFCLVDRKSHRDRQLELEAQLRAKGCPYSIALL